MLTRISGSEPIACKCVCVDSNHEMIIVERLYYLQTRQMRTMMNLWWASVTQILKDTMNRLKLRMTGTQEKVWTLALHLMSFIPAMTIEVTSTWFVDDTHDEEVRNVKCRLEPNTKRRKIGMLNTAGQVQIQSIYKPIFSIMVECVPVGKIFVSQKFTNYVERIRMLSDIITSHQIFHSVFQWYSDVYGIIQHNFSKSIIIFDYLLE